MMLANVLSYLDRQVLAVLSPTILHDTGMNAEAYGRRSGGVLDFLWDWQPAVGFAAGLHRTAQRHVRGRVHPRGGQHGARVDVGILGLYRSALRAGVRRRLGVPRSAESGGGIVAPEPAIARARRSATAERRWAES